MGWRRAGGAAHSALPSRDTLSVFLKTFQCNCAVLASGCLAGILIINNNILHNIIIYCICLVLCYSLLKTFTYNVPLNSH